MPIGARVNEIQAPDPSTLKEDIKIKNPGTQSQKMQKNFESRSRDEANASTTGDKRRLHLTWAGTLLLGNEIKRQLLSKEALPRKKRGVEGSRGVGGGSGGGEGFCPARKLKPSQAN